MAKLRFTPSIIPNLFTAMNMFCGFLSIINTSQQKYFYAAWLIIIAAIFDALDGFMARLTKSSSELGVELDSLSDVVSFGTAPAFLIYSIYLFQYEVLGILISSLLLIAGGFRLARFNVQLVGFDKKFFKGLPIPTAAIVLISFILTFYNTTTGFSEFHSKFIIPIVIILSLLMVSKVKYDTIPSLSIKGFKANPLASTFALLAILLLIITRGQALFYIFVFILVFGIFRHVYYFAKQKSK
ncbi:MAG: CDP-diacylglycerol--serine O-phosphatidyltransferase [Ignavibacteriaceae bacterium]|nr:CDP-diacylglycerol--serine O-phosphatidyltransferase [Ignavibacteriaceae bacterium]